MNTLAKRLYNLSPRPMRLTLVGGETIDLEPSSAEFFGEAFQAEGVSDDVTHRLVTDGEDDPLLIARETAEGWDILGEIREVEAAE